MSALTGKRIVVTRAAEQAAGLCGGLEGAGAVVIRCPTIRVVPPVSYVGLDAALAGIDDYRWIVFTSTNGVRAVLSRMAELGRPVTILEGSRVAAVGTSTARALEAQGVRPAFIPQVERSWALAGSLSPVEGEYIILVRADIADAGVAETLRQRGAARVEDVAAYRTLLLSPTPEVLEELRRGVDGITFTSPSTVRGFLGIGSERRGLLDGAVVASLGPATTEAAQREGIVTDVEAVERSMSGLVDALGEAFSRASAFDEESAK